MAQKKEGEPQWRQGFIDALVAACREFQMRLDDEGVQDAVNERLELPQ